MNTQRRLSLALAGIVLLGLCLSSTAQQPKTLEQQPTQEEKLPIPELKLAQQESVVVPVALPRECARIKPDVQMHGVADNFTPPGGPVTLSPALASFLNSHNLTPKGYDDPRINMVFADSFKLGNCKVCYATLEVRVRHYQDIWSNDTLTVGAAPFAAFPARLLYTNIWPNGSHTYVLPANGLSSLIWNNQGLDVVAQDDTDFDYTRLSVWYY
jgi:hypothetical protein